MPGLAPLKRAEVAETAAAGCCNRLQPMDVGLHHRQLWWQIARTGVVQAHHLRSPKNTKNKCNKIVLVGKLCWLKNVTSEIQFARRQNGKCIPEQFSEMYQLFQISDGWAGIRNEKS